jgi:hypothetical protein
MTYIYKGSAAAPHSPSLLSDIAPGFRRPGSLFVNAESINGPVTLHLILLNNIVLLRVIYKDYFRWSRVDRYQLCHG